MFKILSKEEVFAKSILSNLKDLKENIKMKKFCVLSNTSVQSKIVDFKEEAVELLRMGIDEKFVKWKFSLKIEKLIDHNCECCDRSYYDMNHDFEEFGAKSKVEEFWWETWDEYLNYENIEFDDDDY